MLRDEDSEFRRAMADRLHGRRSPSHSLTVEQQRRRTPSGRTPSPGGSQRSAGSPGASHPHAVYSRTNTPAGAVELPTLIMPPTKVRDALKQDINPFGATQSDWVRPCPCLHECVMD